MSRVRIGGPPNAVRPYVPNPGAKDTESQKADALEHIAVALSAIDHTLEAILSEMRKQTALMGKDGQPR